MTQRISLLASHGVQALDITGPSSVFSAANELLSKENHYSIDVASPDGGLIKTVSGVSIQTTPITAQPVDGIDTLLIGGHNRSGSEALIEHVQARAWVTRAVRTSRRWGSVCSGAFVLAAWGLLSNKKAATHWSAVDDLADRYPSVQVDKDSLFVVDGSVWTSAGVTAGIDMSLAMVEADFGADLATKIARHLVVYLRRPGSQSQFSEPLKSQLERSSPYYSLLDWIVENLKNDLSVETLAANAGQSTRTFQRRFAKHVGATPAAYVESVRIERAKALIASDVALQSVARDVGFSSATQLSVVFHRHFGVAPSVWKAMHCR